MFARGLSGHRAIDGNFLKSFSSVSAVGIKDANLLPTRFVVVNEAEMSFGNLIVVVSLPSIEDHVQSDVIHPVIDRSGEFIFTLARSEEGHTRMILQVLVALLNHVVHGTLTWIIKRKVNVVNDHLGWSFELLGIVSFVLNEDVLLSGESRL